MKRKSKQWFLRILTTFILTSSIHAADTSLPPLETKNHILFMMHRGNTAQALESYRELVKQSGRHDFDLIEELGLTLLDQGYRSKDPEIQLMTLFGASISMNEKALYIIEGSLESKQPELEIIALHSLGQFQSGRADHALYKAMISNSLLIRLEAVFTLCQKKDSKAFGHAEALMAKLPEQIWPLFPQLFAVLGTPEAKKVLKKFLTHRDEIVRIAAIDAIAEYGHDDFLPSIRRLATHHGPSQQEACAAALGILRDEDSTPRLHELAKSPTNNVKLASFQALYRLGRHEIRKEVEKIAKTEDPFAIFLLGSMAGSEATLAPLLKSDNLHTRINAAMALLELKDSRCLPIVADFLLSDSRDLAVVKSSSPGKTLMALRVVPSARQNLESTPVALEISLHVRETALAKAVELPENEFLALADLVFEKQQNDLVPVLVDVLINHPTPNVIALLKKHRQKAGAPLVRNYCNLALYKLKEEGPYADNLEQWVTQQRNVDLIRFRPTVPWDIREEESFQLTPQETSRLLVEAFESFVANQDDKGINTLISLIQTGNPKNKYALIGLLMRAIQ